ncbi:enoyl-CoA hydratase [Neptunomonas sp. XY-337]|uniref:enoyl-CoA hydratase n=1 Tax=Neptunomonas sp. XY-337 TaxID=2561897 RepID=UPI0010AA82E2|nr:enoyl-CoA hydratase [Neptunomonas sp. XY-337]
MSQLIEESIVDGVAHVTLCRPDAYNSLSMELMTALTEALVNYDSDESVRVVVIAGAGKGFCAGHDLKQMIAADSMEFNETTFKQCSTLMQTIVNLSVPVIAQVHGVATAAGCQLVASCDLAFAAQSARFGTPGVNIGLFCSTPMVALTRAVQPKHAMELLLTGQLIGAERAVEMGLINQHVEDETLNSHVVSVAQLIASKSRKTLTIGKQAFNQQRNLTLESAYEHCSQVMVDNMQTDDAQEGIAAFIEKRHPKWRHS